MSNRRIDDHSFWAGGKPKGTVFPEKAKMKEVPSTEGAGELNKYEDTNEAIVSTQKSAVSQIKKRPLKPGTRY